MVEGVRDGFRVVTKRGRVEMEADEARKTNIFKSRERKEVLDGEVVILAALA